MEWVDGDPINTLHAPSRTTVQRAGLVPFEPVPGSRAPGLAKSHGGVEGLP